MKNIQRILIFAVCLCTAFTIQAQSLTVTGKVIDAEGLEVIGANITLKGASGVGSISDLSGNYRLKVDNAAKAILVFSYIGMKTQEVPVKGKAVVNVTLQSDAKALDEVVVVGYGTSKRSDLTGSVVSVKSEDLMKMPTSDVAQALAGRVAGVQITQSEGAPGLKFPSGYVEVFPLPKATSPSISSTASPAKTGCQLSTLRKSKPLIS